MARKSQSGNRRRSFFQRLFAARRKRRRDTRRGLLLEQVEARTLFNADFGIAHDSPLLAVPAEVATPEVQACIVTSESIQQTATPVLDTSGAWTPQVSDKWFGVAIPSEPRNFSIASISTGPSLATISWMGQSIEVMDRDWIIQFGQVATGHIQSLGDVSVALEAVGLRAERIRGLGMEGLVSVTFSSGVDAEKVVAALGDDARVSFFEPATVVESLSLPNDPRFSDQVQDYQTAAFSLGLAGAWDITTGSEEVVVGLLDTGFDFNHIDLRDNVWNGSQAGSTVHGKDFVNSDDSPQDDNGHGTHVAGIIGAQGDNGVGTSGIAWDVSLLGLKVLEADGTGSNADIAAGINYATMLRQSGEANVRVLNASFASSLPSAAISNAIQAAGEAGIMLVTAAGNSGEDIDQSTHQSFPAEYPHDNIIVVANVQADGTLTSSSNYGNTEVDIAAPGMSILSTARGDSYSELSGTSMSAPVVSGALALAWSIAPNATPAELKRALLNSATPSDSLAGKLRSGGIVNVEAFLQSIVDGPGQNGRLNSPLVSEGDVQDVRVSPDGNHIVYVADAMLDGVEQVYVVDPAGGSVRQLTNFDAPTDLRDLQITSDSQHIVFQADVGGVTELYSVPVGGGAVQKLNAELVGSGDVILFKVSPSNDRVIYLADQDVDEVQELYSVPIQGGEVVQLHGDFASGKGVSFNRNWNSSFQAPFEITADGSTVVFMADPQGGVNWRLFAAPTGGGATIELNQSLATDERVDAFDMTLAGNRVIYSVANASGRNLHSVELAGAGRITLANSILGNDFRVTPDGTRVVYTKAADSVSPPNVFSVPTTGGASINLSQGIVGFDGTSTVGGNLQRAIFSPDSSVVVFVDTQSGLSPDSRGELHFASLDGTRHGTMTTNLGGDSQWFTANKFVFSADSSQLVFETIEGTTNGVVYSLYSAPLDGGPTTLLQRLPAGRQFLETYSSGGDFDITSDSSRVVFAANPEAGFELFSVPLTGGAITKLTPDMVTGGRVEGNYGFYLRAPDDYFGRSWALTPDGSRAIYRADQRVDGQTELYSVSVNGSPPVFDYGDAPESYSAGGANDDARHLAVGPTLGSLRDVEAESARSGDARGDDLAGLDDEDGVSWGTLSVGQQDTQVVVKVTNAEAGAKLDAWIDFNGDGIWQSSEQIATNLSVGNGNNLVTFNVPGTAVSSDTFSRFRLSTTGNLAPSGLANDGEVEDHEVTIEPGVPRPRQIVGGNKGLVLGRAGESVTFGVEYSTSDDDNTLTGLGLRLHYDSSVISFEQLDNVYPINLIQQQGPLADTSNFDGDAATDKYVLIAWSDPFGGNWPNADLPTDLLDASFRFVTDVAVGTETTVHLTSSSSAASHDFSGNDIHLTVAPNVSLDVDSDCHADALTDGVIILRYLFGFRGDELVGGAIRPDANRTDPVEIAEYLDGGRDTMLDVDGNGVADALTDGIITFRYLFGFEGDALVENALGAAATRTDPAEIADFLDSFLPECPLTQSTIAAIGGDEGRSSIMSDPSRQIVTPSELHLTLAEAGASFTFDVDYSTVNPIDATLTGLGLRVHFDSDRLELKDLSNVLGTNFVQQQGPLEDTSDFDGDSDTDKYVLFAWSDPFGGNWPGVLPATLFSPTFEATAGFTNGETHINFTASSTAAGFDFDGTSVVVSLAANNAAPTLTAFDGAVQSGDEDRTVAITFADLATHGNEQDADGTVEAFVVTSVARGTLKIGADQASATPFAVGANDLVNATRKAFWTPDANANGVLDAFSVVARDDDGEVSITPITARVNLQDVNDAPVLTRIADIVDTTVTDQEVEITFNEIAGQGDEQDIDGQVEAFVVKSVSSGSLKIGPSAASATPYAADTNDTIDATRRAYWTPSADASGRLPAFTVVARDDDGSESANAITTRVQVNQLIGTDDLAAIAIRFVNQDAEVVESVSVGQEFQIVVSIQDLRQSGDDQGAFGAMLDVLYDTSLIDVLGITHQSPFTIFTSGTINDDNGLVDDLGGLDGIQQPETRDPQVVVVLDAIATAAGDLTVRTQQGNNAVIYNLLFGIDGDVTENTVFGNAVLQILDPEISITDATKLEGNDGETTFEFEVSISRAPSSTVVVDYGTALHGLAGVSDIHETSGSVTFTPDGPLTQTVSVNVVGDREVEENETFELLLTGVTGNAVIVDSIGIGTIVNDDLSTISIADAHVSEGGGTLEFNVSLSAPASEEVTATITVVGGSASSSDYSPFNTSVTFAPGETTKVVTVDVNDDAIVETDESLIVELSDPRFKGKVDNSRAVLGDSLATGTIENNDTAEVSISDESQSEGDGKLRFTISLSSPASDEVTIVANTISDSADAGSDFETLRNHTITFFPGETEKIVEVGILDDQLVEVDEVMNLGLSDARFAGTDDVARVTIAKPTGGGVITNDDIAVVDISDISDASIIEGDSGTTSLTFEITLSTPASKEVTLVVNTMDGSAKAESDYHSIHNQVVTFAPGEVKRIVSVEIIGETLPELAEQFSVSVSDARFNGAVDSSRVLIGDGDATGTISPDDALMQINVEFRDLEGNTLDRIGLGQAFEIVLSAQDLREIDLDKGVFSALADVLFDTQLVDITGVRHVAPFNQAVTGTLDELAGEVDDVGGIQGLQQPVTRDAQEFLVLEAVGVAAGRLTVNTRAGEDDVVKNLLFGIDDDVTGLTEFNSQSIDLGFADLVATSFDVVSDHVLKGETTATFTIMNQGDVAADAFDVRLFLSDDSNIGSDDDSLVKVVSVPALEVGESTTITVDLQLDVATLFRRAKADDPTGQGAGSISTSEGFIGLIINGDSSVLESDVTNNSNEGQGIDLDNVTYFPWDVDSDGVVSGLDAIFVLNRLGQNAETADARADLDGDGIVTSLDAIAVINRLGYLINSDVFEAANAKASLGEGESHTDALHNELMPTDVNGDGVTSPIDALQVINSLDDSGLPSTGYRDVNGDGEVTQADADAIVEFVNDAMGDPAPRDGTSVAQALQGNSSSLLLPAPEAESRSAVASKSSTNGSPQLLASRESNQQPVVTSATLMPLSDAIFGDEKSDAADPVDELESALDQIAGDIAETWDDMLE